MAAPEDQRDLPGRSAHDHQHRCGWRTTPIFPGGPVVVCRREPCDSHDEFEVRCRTAKLPPVTAALDPDHPKQTLLFFVSQDLDLNGRSELRDLVHRLASHKWINGPPRFVNSSERPTNTSRGDMASETVGGFVEIYSTLPPWTLPREIDRLHFEEVSTLVNALRDFSRQNGLSFEFELDGKFVGAIDNGEMDAALGEGLLGEWRRNLDN
jgi:hypothetical protein